MASSESFSSFGRGADVPVLNQLIIDVVESDEGKRLARGIAKALNITTVGALIHHFPRRYMKRGDLTQLNQLEHGEEVTIIARVLSSSRRDLHTRKGSITDIVVTDNAGFGDTMKIGFFNGYTAFKELKPLTVAMFSGKVGSFNGDLTLTNPQYDLLPDDEMTEFSADYLAATPIPVYPSGSGFASWRAAHLIKEVLPKLGLDQVPDPVPEHVVKRHKLMPLAEAYWQIHLPATDQEKNRAQRRFRFQEALALQTYLAQRRHESGKQLATGRPGLAGGLLQRFDEKLPFSLTTGQRDIGELIAQEISQGHPMHRLLQGEVGSGKTIVALRAMLQVIDSGGQAAFLAPTEVLASQHAASITKLLGDLGQGTLLGGPHATTVTLLTGSLPTAARKKALLAAASGEAGIVIGTHALLSDNVQFADLGLIVVDEQHRFGVEQRDVLRAKAQHPPHVLVMTATPIPRTVAMTVFGDLEVSELRELPAGRSPLKTHIAPLLEHPAWEERVWVRSREEVDQGRQVYVVCPKIGDDGNDALFEADAFFEPADGTAAGEARPMAGVLDVVQYLQGVPALAGTRIEMLHGRMDTDEKARVMADFASGAIDVLVATTVIEVGVDVKNATLMVILDAERFGISQLHQLRGRVGRGEHGGTCLLVTRLEPWHPSRQRLEAVAATTDGFELARSDLQMRREGDILGAHQSGTASGLRNLKVLRDEELIDRARAAANEIVADDPTLERHGVLKLEIEIYVTEQNEAFLERG